MYFKLKTGFCLTNVRYKQLLFYTIDRKRIQVSTFSPFWPAMPAIISCAIPAKNANPANTPHVLKTGELPSQRSAKFQITQFDTNSRMSKNTLKWNYKCIFTVQHILSLRKYFVYLTILKTVNLSPIVFVSIPWSFGTKLAIITVLKYIWIHECMLDWRESIHQQWFI